MHRHLGLDLEAAGNGWETLDEAARKHPVAGEDIGEVGPEQALVEAVEDAVAEGVAVAAGIVGHAAPGAHHHVGAFGLQDVDQLRRILRRVGAVAVGHHIDVGIDVGEHAPHHIALALTRLAHDDGAGGAGLQRREVLGIVVVDIDRGRRQRLAEAPHDLADRQLLIVARQEHGDDRLVADCMRHVCLRAPDPASDRLSCRPRRAVLLFIEAVKARFKPILSFKGHGKWAQPRTAPPPGSPIWR
ncbi:hypothetical protein MPLDJ20_200121 [Mesorhizobium plurifarium]|uniref:Uncharacterized protein n=1 Tax=Mesorhizobium plurifarium TaxID=69974 RepID=A0A090F1J5_MESPL|nr:hypothetical protein MPLDJ20_200121 [Mesorhizobium plurifarium]